MSSDDDRLTFGEGPFEPESDQAAGARARPNRAFVFIAIAMAGLILLGVLALIAAWRFWLPARRAEQSAVMTQTAIAMVGEEAATTPTFTAAPATVETPTFTATVSPTETPVPTPTATKVLSADGSTARSAEIPTKTAATKTTEAQATTTPAAGLGGLGTAAIAIGLAGLVLAVRKIRTSS